MVKSMTGYGKGVAQLEGGTLTVEIRSVNGKGADISVKSPLLPKDRDVAVRGRLAAALGRGSIDMYLTWQPSEEARGSRIDKALAQQYLSELKELASEAGVPLDGPAAATLLGSVLRMPDVASNSRPEIITEDNWPLVEKAIDEAIAALDAYRITEGQALRRDITGRIQNILDIFDEIEGYEPERVAAVRERILKAAEELSVKLDPERFEQEMIFYLEKLDTNEEKVRLRQHCQYFLETLDAEDAPGRKLGFIIQEMGREINTTGSKANHASIQKCVVRAKDELEKIREQSMNIL